MPEHEESRTVESLELTLSDSSQLPRLRDWLRTQAGAEVRYSSSLPGPGELGAEDVLTVLAGSSVLATAISTLPDFLRSRRSGLRIEVSARGRKMMVQADNIEEVMPVLERLLDDRD